ncbi:MAG: peptidoglycan bridge formation glycyltransferase FemA/FemB family protein [Candidatus Micrarchaeia archaeon]
MEYRLEKIGQVGEWWDPALPDNASFYQTTECASAQLALGNARDAAFVSGWNHGKLACQLVVYAGNDYPGLFGSGARLAFLAPLANKALRTVWWDFGPVVREGYDYVECAKGCLDALAGWIGSAPVKRASLPLNKGGECDALFAARGFRVARHATAIVDLNPPLEELREHYGKRLRYVLNRAERQGIIVSEVGEGDLRDAYELFAETKKRAGVSDRGYAYFERHWRLFGSGRGTTHALIARKDGKPVALQLFSIFNAAILQGGISYSDYAVREKIYGNDLLQWRLIEWGKAHHCVSDDLAGVNPDAEGKEAGIRAFKEKWGETIEYPLYSKPRKGAIGWFERSVKALVASKREKKFQEKNKQEQETPVETEPVEAKHEPIEFDSVVLDIAIDAVIKDNEAFVRERGERAANSLMGDLMARLEGKCPGCTAYARLEEKIRLYPKA